MCICIYVYYILFVGKTVLIDIPIFFLFSFTHISKFSVKRKLGSWCQVLYDFKLPIIDWISFWFQLNEWYASFLIRYIFAACMYLLTVQCTCNQCDISGCIFISILSIHICILFVWSLFLNQVYKNVISSYVQCFLICIYYYIYTLLCPYIHQDIASWW